MYFSDGLVQSRGMSRTRKPYPSDVSHEEWSPAAPYLTLMRAGEPTGAFVARIVQWSALRPWLRDCLEGDAERSAAPGRGLSRLAAGCCAGLAQHLRALLRLASGRSEEPTAAIIDSRTPPLDPGKRPARRL